LPFPADTSADASCNLKVDVSDASVPDMAGATALVLALTEARTRFPLQFDGQDFVKLNFKAGRAPMRDAMISLNQLAEDLEVIQRYTKTRFRIPDAVSPLERIEVRSVRLMLDGKCVVHPQWAQVSFTLTGDYAESLEAALTGRGAIALSSGNGEYVLLNRQLSVPEIRFVLPDHYVDSAEALVAGLKRGDAAGEAVTFKMRPGEHVRMFMPDLWPDDGAPSDPNTVGSARHRTGRDRRRWLDGTTCSSNLQQRHRDSAPVDQMRRGPASATISRWRSGRHFASAARWSIVPCAIGRHVRPFDAGPELSEVSPDPPEIPLEISPGLAYHRLHAGGPCHEICRRYFVREITILVPEPRVVEFYQRFGEFLSEEAHHAEPVAVAPDRAAGTTEGQRRAPGWIDQPGAEDRAALLWSYLSDAARETLGVLIEGALAEEPRRFTPAEIVEATGNPNGASGVAGTFGAAGRAIRKAQLPRYPSGPDKTWHYVWDWDGHHYWMVREVAALFRGVH
jgi:hypothetical protein